MLHVRLSTNVVAVLLLLILIPGVAQAYLDPASGSIILQVVLGGIAGAGLLIKIYWDRFLKMIGLRKAEDEAGEV